MAAVVRGGSGKAKLPPIPPCSAPTPRPGSSAAHPDAGLARKDGTASSTSSGSTSGGSCQHVASVMSGAADECNALLKQLTQQARQVERDVEAKLRVAIQEATSYLEQELAAAQRRSEAEKEGLMGQVQKLTASYLALELREKEVQQICSELKSREEALLAEQASASSSLAAAAKERRNAEDLLAAQKLQHQQELQTMMDKHGGQLSDIDRSGEESKKKNQQLTNQMKQLRDVNAKLTARLSEEETLRQKMELQRREENGAHSSAAKKQALEVSKLKNELAACQQDLAKAMKSAELLEKQLQRQQAEHSDTLKKAKSHHAATTAVLNEKIQQLEQEIVDLRHHYQAEIERLRKEMAEKMHASLDNWMGQDDTLLKKLRQQNLEEKGRLDAERHASGAGGGRKKTSHHRQ